jgi:hypothetical protein
MLGKEIREPYATIPAEPSGISMVFFLFAAETDMQERNSTDKQSDKPKIDMVEEVSSAVMGIPPSCPIPLSNAIRRIAPIYRPVNRYSRPLPGATRVDAAWTKPLIKARFK